MKKTIFLLVILFLSLSLLGSSHEEVSGIRLKDYAKKSAFFQSLSLKATLELGEIIVLPIEEFSEADALKMIERLDQLPISLLQKINRENIKVKFFVGKLTDNPTASHLMGVIPRGYVKKTTWDDVPGIGGARIVLVKIGYSEKGRGHGSVNLELHELAHSVDRYVLQNIHSSPSFLRLWNEEKEQLFPGQPYFLNYPEEYFAETFAMYFLNAEEKQQLKSLAPKTYAFMKNLR